MTNELEQVRDLNPAVINERVARPPRSQWLAADLDAVDDMLPPARRRTRRLLLAVPAAACLAFAAIVFMPSAREGASPGAQAALSGAASVASADAAPAARFDYYKVESAAVGTAVDEQTYSWLTPVLTETWVDDEGAGRVRSEGQGIVWPGPRDRQRWEAQGAPSLTSAADRSTDKSFDAGELTGAPSEGALPAVRDLPADPDQLQSIFARQAAETSTDVPENIKMFEYCASGLLSEGARPDLRAALYTLIARIDGVRYDSSVRDPRGREGEAVSIVSDYSGAQERYSLVFDSRTSFPFAYQETLLEAADWIDGNMLSYSVLVDSGAVESTQQRADGS